jgi:iron complex transport system substrate-binding protein
MTALRLTAALFALITVAAPLRAEVIAEDDAGRRVSLAQPAHRIVSLAPHVTELLFAAGAGEHVVGAVAYSDYPDAARTLPRVGGSGNVDIEAVAALKPDLVIAWKSGNQATHLEKFAALGIAVYVNEPRSLDDVAHSLETFGRLAGTERSGRAQICQNTVTGRRPA